MSNWKMIWNDQEISSQLISPNVKSESLPEYKNQSGI